GIEHRVLRPPRLHRHREDPPRQGPARLGHVAGSGVTRELDGPVERFVTDVTAALVRLARQVPNVQAAALPADVNAEAFNIAAAFVEADHHHTEHELWPLISAFAGRLETSLGFARPDDVRKAGLV